MILLFKKSSFGVVRELIPSPPLLFAQGFRGNGKQTSPKSTQRGSNRLTVFDTLLCLEFPMNKSIIWSLDSFPLSRKNIGYTGIHYIDKWHVKTQKIIKTNILLLETLRMQMCVGICCCDISQAFPKYSRNRSSRATRSIFILPGQYRVANPLTHPFVQAAPHFPPQF